MIVAQGGVIVTLLVHLAFGAVCAMLASSRGRSAAGWFFIGFFLNCIGLVILLVLPDLREEQDHRRRLATENRRMREQLRKDRQVGERRFSATQQRLDAHDRALRVDTSPMLDEADAEALASPPPAPAPSPARQDFERALWFYLVDQEQVGPVPFAELRKVWREGRIGGTTYIWREGMDEWRPLRDLPELEGEFRA